MTQYQPGSFIRVWLGVLAASPGVPPRPCPDSETFIAEVSHTNSIGQVYIWPRWAADGRRLTSNGLFVFASAILGPAMPPTTEGKP